MAIRDVLLLLEPRPRGSGSAEFAISLARQTQAHLTAVTVVLDLAPPTSFLGGSSIASGEVGRRAREEAESFYRAEVASAGLATNLVIIQAVAGDARARFARVARCHDLVVMRQPARDAPTDHELLAEAALFGSGRAVFLVPASHSGAAKLRKALIAWDGGPTAARALAESLPLLRRAEEVEVVAVNDGADTSPASLADMVRHLALHGVKAHPRGLRGGRDVGAVLLAYAAELGVDYLVMGAYGHSRMREFILGGATRAVLRGMATPTLMAH